MTDQQLYLAIGVPIVANALAFLLLSARITDLSTGLNKRIDDLRAEMNARFDSLERLFEEKLLRVEEVIDAR